MFTDECLVQTHTLDMHHYPGDFHEYIGHLSEEYKVGIIPTGDRSLGGPTVRVVGPVQRVLDFVAYMWGGNGQDYIFARSTIGDNFARHLFDAGHDDSAYPGVERWVAPKM